MSRSPLVKHESDPEISSSQMRMDVVRVPTEHAEDILRLAGEVRAKEADVFGFYDAPDFSMDKLREKFKR